MLSSVSRWLGIFLDWESERCVSYPSFFNNIASSNQNTIRGNLNLKNFIVAI